MNRTPNTSGITGYWKPGEDDRCVVRDECGLDGSIVDAVLDALHRVVVRQRRTKIVGFGVFEWKTWNNRLPTGRHVATWSLSFKSCRYRGKYVGEQA